MISSFAVVVNNSCRSIISLSRVTLLIFFGLCGN